MARVDNSNLSMIMYHYVRPLKNSKYPNLKALELTKFKEQIRWFKKEFDILDYDQFLEIINSKKLSKRKKLILTFDDGYKDNYNSYKALINTLFTEHNIKIGHLTLKKILDGVY